MAKRLKSSPLRRFLITITACIACYFIFIYFLALSIDRYGLAKSEVSQQERSKIAHMLAAREEIPYVMRSPNGIILFGLFAAFLGREAWLAARAYRSQKLLRSSQHRNKHDLDASGAIEKADNESNVHE